VSTGVRENLPVGVTWDNWQEYPANRWSYQHLDDVLDTVPVPRGDGPVLELGRGAALDVPELDRYLDESRTDGLLVLRGRQVVLERYLNHLTPSTRHLLQSVSKSMCSAVFGRYVASGDIDLGQPASHYVPELADSAYGEATLRHTLDMTVAVAYDETYDDPESDIFQHDRAGGWRPPSPGSPEHVRAFLAGLRSNGEHGRTFQYCSANSDVLAVVLEAVTGRRFSELLSTDLWAPMGAEHDALITVDSSGLGMASGGICVTLRDLARFGRLLLDGGAGPSGEQVVPRPWLDDVRRGGAPTVDATSIQEFDPNGSYRSQFWVTGDPHGCIYGAGIYGQYVWLNPQTDVAVARLASQQSADDDEQAKRNQQLLDRLSVIAG
jgi:CubicO group peptidase (beta-lactamase class C family)